MPLRSLYVCIYVLGEFFFYQRNDRFSAVCNVIANARKELLSLMQFMCWVTRQVVKWLSNHQRNQSCVYNTEMAANVYEHRFCTYVMANSGCILYRNSRDTQFTAIGK